MNLFDAAGTPPGERSDPLAQSHSQLDFTRAFFAGKNGRNHIESRCNQCSFRITATPSNDIDDQEREHARGCQGSQRE